MQIDEAAGVVDLDVGVTDLGPLAWVLDELRKSLEVANKSLKRFVRDAEVARGTDLASVDASQLRMARQQMHQAVGALEMVGLAAPAHMLRAMESAVQQFVQRPDKCNEASAAALERASFALVEYLGVILNGSQQSAVGLFPQYRDAQMLAGADRIHPADLWSMPWRWIRPDTTGLMQGSQHAAAVDRSFIDQSVLLVMQKGDAKAAVALRDVCAMLSSSEGAQGVPSIFWTICAAYFDAIAAALLPVDLYVKRAASQVLLQYAAFLRGDRNLSERLAKDLLFFCAQAKPASPQAAPFLFAVRKAYGLERADAVDYEYRRYGLFDPAILSQARKRIEAVKESWSALAGGDTVRLKNVVDQFGLVADSILKLHPKGERLAAGLKHAAELTARSGRPPGAEVALEVATSVLYLEAAMVDQNPDDEELSGRTNRLADRLELVCGGGQAEPLESWMEELYRRVSDRQTMGTVVGELRITLNEAEKALDQFFRNPAEKAVLNDVPALLAQMRGVLSVLGLDQASQAVMRMKARVEQILATDFDVNQAREAGTFDNLGNNLGALGFLVDMLNYQPALAKKLFVYDEALGELRPLMGRSASSAAIEPVPDSVDEPAGVPVLHEAVGVNPIASEPAWALDFDLPEISPEAVHALVEEEAGTRQDGMTEAADRQVPQTAAEMIDPGISQPEVDLEEDDLQEIFLEEAREVIQNGLEALDALASDPLDLTQQTTLRRAFHTLKGSSRMVGLMEFGEAAWSMEQLLNAWLSEQKPANPELCGLSREALTGFAKWVEDIEAGLADHWAASAFQVAADGLRKENTRLPLLLPSDVPVASVETDLQAAVTDALEFPEGGGIEVIESLEPAAEELNPFGDGDPVILLDALEEPVEDVQKALSFEAMEVVELPGMDLDAFAEASEPPAVADSIAFGEEAAGEAIASPSSLVDDGLPLELPESVMDDEQIKLIGSLRIGIPLYNVYLNEADEWSRRLLTQLTEWSMELHRPVPTEAEALAHSLAGSSATVGFLSLSEMARALEHALQRMHEQSHGTETQGQVFREAAEDIRRLLHQFAAGFLKEPNATILADLRSLEFHEDVIVSQYGDAGEEDRGEAALARQVPAERDILVGIDVPALPEPEPVSEVALPVAVVSVPGIAGEPPPEVIGPASSPSAELPEVALAGRQSFSFLEQDHAPDDLDLVDVLDPDLFPIFEEEAAELLPQMGGALRQWAARPENLTARGEVLRALHTLKGSSRLAGALQLGEMAHRMESEIESIGTEMVQGEDISPLMTRLDALEGKFATLRKVNLQAFMPELATPPFTGELVDAAGEVGALDAVEPAMVASNPRSSIALPAPMLVAPVRAAANQAVRVRSQLLDRLVNQAGEVMITRSRLEAEMGQLRGSLQDLTGNLDRLRQQLRDIELQAESQMQSRMAQAKDSQQNFDPLEFDRFTRVQELTRMMAESVNDVATVQRNLQRTVEATEDDLIAQARQTRALQQDLLRTRMMEFEGISDRLYRVVRQASKDTGKQVKLDINGGSIEMDRGVLDRMTAAFEHLLRNCVVHGIEEPLFRKASGKDAVGTITIDLHQAGNDVSVTFHDDGAGLDVHRILEKAVQHGLVSPGQVLSEEEAANLIFMPGLTTAAEVTELAGRGIGMDVVRSEVQALGGRIETETKKGQGTSFKLVLPLTTAVTQVVLMRSGALSLGVPANLVELVRRVSAKELQEAYRTGGLTFSGESVPFFWSGALLQSSHHSTEPDSRTMPVVVFRSAAQRVAVHMDEILGNQEAVVKNLGPQLSRLPGLAGMTVLASGAVILIYNPVALATVYGEQARQYSALQAQKDALEASAVAQGVPVAAPVTTTSRIPLVLVVDDSITVRRVTQRLLQREGYRVALAADGLQALERLQEERPVVVLSDIEMPRMDGFDLARNIRGDDRLKDLPIIMITSRIAEKHKEHAQTLGVNHYLGKPYSEEELLSLVRHYVEVPVPA